MKKALAYIVPITFCFLLGYVAGRLQAYSVEHWYPLLEKPSLTPPNWVFPVAWGILYLFSGIPAGLAYTRAGIARCGLITLWTIQQFFNFTWSITFFMFENPVLGFINIVILDALVIIYAIRVWRVSHAASVLFWPYICWILFASYLNLYIMLHN